MTMANTLADKADDRIQNVIDGGIAIAREKAAKVRALVPINECYYCGHTLNMGRVFCDADCAGDYHHLLRREKANGLI